MGENSGGEAAGRTRDHSAALCRHNVVAPAALISDDAGDGTTECLLYFHLYLVLDIFSRKIVEWAVHAQESGEHAAALISAACLREGVQRDELALHSDNGAPMKCGNLLALLQWLGVAASFSRPGVSDDNPFVEALFRTLKYRPDYPDAPFASIEDARAFIARFVHWYYTHTRARRSHDLASGGAMHTSQRRL